MNPKCKASANNCGRGAEECGVLVVAAEVRKKRRTAKSRHIAGNASVRWNAGSQSLNHAAAHEVGAIGYHIERSDSIRTDELKRSAHNLVESAIDDDGSQGKSRDSGSLRKLNQRPSTHPIEKNPARESLVRPRRRALGVDVTNHATR